MIDYRLQQSQQVERERRQMVELVSLEQFRAKANTYEPGSTYFWALGAVYGPPADKRKQS